MTSRRAPGVETGAAADGGPLATPPPGHPRFPLVDALRALAALCIVLVHAAIFSGVLEGAPYRRLVAHLDIGVALFFLLSGFLLYRPFLASRRLGAPRAGGGAYARRRLTRIAPAYWLALTVLTAATGLHGAFSSTWWVYYGLVQNWPVAAPPGGCVTDPFRCGIAPAWSLAIEVLFYAALPVYALGLAALARRLRRVPWFGVELGGLAVLTVVSVLVQSLTLPFTPWLFFSPLGRGWWFALGMGLAGLSVWVQERGAAPPALRWMAAHPGAVWAVAGVLYVVPALGYFEPTPLGAFPVGALDQYVAEYLLFGVICAGLLLPAIFGGAASGWPRHLLAAPGLRWLGTISYGIFLWHFPILLELVDRGAAGWWPGMAYPVLVLATLALTVPCAALSYYALERPLMRWRRLTDQDRARGTPELAAGPSAPAGPAGARAST